jgi:hypothetical protein
VLNQLAAILGSVRQLKILKVLPGPRGGRLPYPYPPFVSFLPITQLHLTYVDSSPGTAELVRLSPALESLAMPACCATACVTLPHTLRRLALPGYRGHRWRPQPPQPDWVSIAAWAESKTQLVLFTIDLGDMPVAHLAQVIARLPPGLSGLRVYTQPEARAGELEGEMEAGCRALSERRVQPTVSVREGQQRDRSNLPLVLSFCSFRLCDQQ